MIDIQVKDNLLSSFQLKELQTMFYGDQFPWFLSSVLSNVSNPYTGNFKILCSDMENYQFIHLFVSNDGIRSTSPYIDLIKPIIAAIDNEYPYLDTLIRIKANLNPRTSSIVRHGFHKDHYKDDVKASIFYVNSCDGYTEFEDGTRIESVANRLITFPQHIKHRGTTCTNKPYRMVINFNYF